MVIRAGRLLAGVTGKERVMTVNHGHMLAFIKAAITGCKTPFKLTHDPSGKTDKTFLPENKECCITFG